MEESSGQLAAEVGEQELKRPEYVSCCFSHYDHRLEDKSFCGRTLFLEPCFFDVIHLMKLGTEKKLCPECSKAIIELLQNGTYKSPEEEARLAEEKRNLLLELRTGGASRR